MPVKTKLVSIIQRAETLKASDIHFILKENKILVQFRVGAFMIPHEAIPISLYEQLLAYIKFQASLTLTHPRQPQSGLLQLQTDSTIYYTRESPFSPPHTTKVLSYASLIINNKKHSMTSLTLFKMSIF